MDSSVKLNEERAALEKKVRELEQGFQSLELKLNTVPCSRGDFAFTTITFGQWDPAKYDEREKSWLYMIGKIMLQVRRNGHGKDGKPVGYRRGQVFFAVPPEVAS
jgi:ribonucleoside-triphosphate reductase